MQVKCHRFNGIFVTVVIILMEVIVRNAQLKIVKNVLVPLVNAQNAMMAIN